ncbi:hypothetical protein [Planifilum fulgidum]|uniref:hypothetical protein n=1 Tax=Planifilum fulgidum TaxID=201973 RepID=UPI000B8723B9|nr:hypothetical protein [Planifilum fulgidum]
MFRRLLYLTLLLLILVGCQTQNDKANAVQPPRKISLDTSNVNGFITEQDGVFILHAASYFKNTGEAPVYIRDVKFHFESTDGSNLSTVTPLFSTPAIVRPNEFTLVGGTSYVKQDLTNMELGQVKVNVKFAQTNLKESKWKIDINKHQETQYGYMVFGRVTNTSDKPADFT